MLLRLSCDITQAINPMFCKCNCSIEQQLIAGCAMARSGWPRPHIATGGRGRHACADRFVGLFYFLWHNRTGHPNAMGDGPYDVSKILRKDPAALNDADSPLWGPVGTPHYWGEPLYGYYRSDDPWVLRRHAYFLADAGIDVLIFDTTNAATYPGVYHKLCEVFQDLRRQGETTPRIAFMVNTRAGETADKVFHDLYRPGHYPELWFRWQGKPLLICDPAQASTEVRKFFTLRRAHWPFAMVNTDHAWHWEAAYPQPYGFIDDPDRPEQVNVSVAQNLRKSDAQVTNMSDGDARGRSFHQGTTDPSPDAVNYGHNFQEQWHRACELDPPFVMITGWNEWIAGRFQRPGKPIVFVDQFDQEHSRDIEFARHGHRDNYYYQMVANIRRYKGVPQFQEANSGRTIDLKRGFDQWDDIVPEYRDHVGETIPRNYPGVGGKHYKMDTGRNDILTCKVTGDAEFVYFYLQATQSLQPSPSPRGLWLLIDTDQRRNTGWEGYDLIVGRAVDERGRVWLERHIKQWQWHKVAPVEHRQVGSELHLALPRSTLGKPGNLAFDFKWADNLPNSGDVQDFYQSGDVAPEGRFNYRAALK